jgi:hypothetical protein
LHGKWMFVRKDGVGVAGYVDVLPLTVRGVPLEVWYEKI